MSRPRWLAALTILVALPSGAFAGDASQDRDARTGQRWGISLWGLSYHVDRSVDYDEGNWGLGFRYSPRPQWKWLGRNENNRLFTEVDALRNSHGGLVLPVSAGVEYEIKALPGNCHLLAVGALTLAYYQNLRTQSDYFKFGPVPGVSFRCGHVQPNAIAVLSPNGPLLAAIVASVTFRF